MTPTKKLLQVKPQQTTLTAWRNYNKSFTHCQHNFYNDNNNHDNNNNNSLNILMQDCCISFKKKTEINAGPVKNLKKK